jgi:hypothetical protein
MSTGDDDADRFRVPRWISGQEQPPGERPTTQDEPRYSRSQPFDAEDGAAYTGAARTPPLNAGEPLWPSAPDPSDPAASSDRAGLPPPVTRGQRAAAEPQRRGLIVVAFVAALVVIVAVVLLVGGGSDEKKPVGAPTTAAAPPPVVAPSTTPAAPTSRAGPTSKAGSPSAAGPTDGPRTGRPAGPDGGNPFGPLTIEAEAPGNTLTGSAFVADYPNASGGRIVRNLGEWDQASGPGTLKFNNVDVPRTGTYTLTFSYVDIDNEAHRTAVIDISGRTGVVITVDGNDSCCRTRTVQVQLEKGRNSIAFSNRTDHAPSIDKIAISASPAV